jgi:ketosteroid isomerase-like protein
MGRLDRVAITEFWRIERRIRQCIPALFGSLVLFNAISHAGNRGVDMSETTHVVQVINDALAAFRSGDLVAFKAAWAPSVEIVDDVPPYLWSGERSLERWIDDTGTAIAKLNLADLDIRAKTPLHVEITGDAAYVVLPVVVSYKRAGKSYIQEGTQVLVMKRTKDGWKMRTMSYAAAPAIPSDQSSVGH